MRLLEGVLIAAQLLNAPRFLEIAIALLHSWKEGRRWQLIPSYLSLLLPANYRWLRITLASVSGILSLALPVFQFPPLKGPHSISYKIIELVDESRPEWSLYGDQSGKRRILVRIWYPADASTANPASTTQEPPCKAPYMNFLDIRSSHFARSMRMPAFLLNHFSLIKSHAHVMQCPEDEMIPLVTDGDTKYPLILFSHGYMSAHDINTALIEQLTSLGCIVASVEHTFDSVFSYLPESNQTIAFDAFPPEGIEGEEFWRFRRHHLQIRTEDLRFMMQYVLTCSDFGPFIDRDRIIAMGHSFGGGTAVNSLVKIDQVKLAVGLDAYMAVLEPSIKDRGVGKPVLLFQAGPRFFASQHFWAETNDEDCRSVVQRSANSRLIRIDGATHYDFIDIPFYANRWLSRIIGMAGPLTGREMLNLLLGHTVDFLCANDILPASLALQTPILQYPFVLEERFVKAERYSDEYVKV